MKNRTSRHFSDDEKELPGPKEVESSIESLEESPLDDFKDFKCSICDRTLATKQSLKEHMFKHAGKKPFKCTEPGCGMTFRQSSQLCNHRKVHKEARLIMERQEKKNKTTSDVNKKHKNEIRPRNEKTELEKIVLPPISQPVFGAVLPSIHSLL